MWPDVSLRTVPGILEDTLGTFFVYISTVH